MPALRVHILIDSLNWGGAETLLADFALGARDRGLDVTVGYLSRRDQSAERLRRIGITPVLVPIETMLGRSDRRKVREHVAAASPDLLHTHLGYSDFLGGLAARALSVPCVSTIHVMHREGGLREATKSRLMGLGRRLNSSRVITVSEAARRAYLASNWDRPGRVRTVRNGIVDRASPGVGVERRRELGISPDDQVVAMVGVLREGKGHELAIEAIAGLRESFPKIRLLIVGDGPDRSRIETAASELGDGVVFAGFREDVLDLLDASDLLVHPSSFDAFPTALLEAMACRVPVIATAVGGIPEIIVDEETGTLIEPPPRAADLAAAIRSLIADPERRDTMARAGRARFDSEFTVDAWMDRLSIVYGEVLGVDPARLASPPN